MIISRTVHLGDAPVGRIAFAIVLLLGAMSVVHIPRQALALPPSDVSSSRNRVSRNRPILFIKLGEAPPSVKARHRDFEHWFANRMGISPDRLQIVDATRAQTLPDPRRGSAVIIPGSSSMVTDPDRGSLRVMHWLEQPLKHAVPILGVCYGHQLLAHMLGGKVANNAEGRRIGTKVVRQLPGASDHALFANLPARMLVQVSHDQRIIEPPPCAKLLAETEGDPFTAFAAETNAYGVQFHPEVTHRIMDSYIAARAQQIRRSGMQPQEVRKTIRESRHGEQLLQNFLLTVDANDE